MENLIWVGLICGVIALIFAYCQSRKVLSFSEGTDLMKKISSAIRRGANAYLKRQYRTVAIVFVIVFIILIILAAIHLVDNFFIPLAFVTGGVCSGLAGFIGMRIATSANARTAHAAHEGLNRGLRVAFNSGSVMGFTVVGLGLCEICLWFLVLHFLGHLDANQIGTSMVMFGVGASFMALFARVGGGIFTKAADVGADLVGKVEAGIPEDDPRNPACIADNVGDNVGDVAGMGADLYESYVGSIHAALALGAAGFAYDGVLQWNSMILPVLMASAGIISALIGSFMVKTQESADQRNLLAALRKGTYFAAILAAVIDIPLVLWLMAGAACKWGIYVSIVMGLAGGCLIGYFTEYFTSDTYKPTKELAESAESGAGPVIISGLALGMKSVIAPVLIVSVCVIVSFFGTGGGSNFVQGLYGIGIAAVGMLSTLGITLATDAYGPVADNAGGIAEMSGLPEEVRERTDALDSLGNTTAATGKGFAIGSAALTALALLVSYVNIATAKMSLVGKTMDLSVTNPAVLIGLFIGAMLVFIFSALAMGAVQHAAQNIVHEVRRQFKEIPGIMEHEAEPDYEACVDLCTRGALKQMVAPSVLAIVVPVITGIILGVNGVVGLLAGATVTGFVVAVFMANAGGAWDNAKKYIEAGNFGGKGSEGHKAGVIGDTVGDPFKDTAGPSLNILIKLVSTVSIVFVGLVVAISIL
ncbi:MAG: sodium-translocating pyrophosphatase [Oscillospiraceae bacterium]|nr:sodium-translocating pyrophosphatase [Oscillospiraceae bacterium]